MTKDDSEIVAERLRQARESLGFTQDEVGDALGIQRTSVHAIETGKRKVSAIELRRFSRLYRKSVEWLLGEELPTQVTPTDGALFRATSALSEEDQAQVLRFAQFLASGSTRSSSSKRPE
jgi:transcriptional regulator with XRE-family HTH domain